MLGLHYLVIEGSLDYFQKLLVGPWDEDFVILEAGEEISLAHLIMDTAAAQTTLTRRLIGGN